MESYEFYLNQIDSRQRQLEILGREIEPLLQQKKMLEEALELAEDELDGFYPNGKIEED